MKQTAVEFLVRELINNNHLKSISSMKQIIEEANEMFEQQIIDAYQNSDNNGDNRIYYHSDRDDKSAEQYYNETFNK